MIEVRCSADTSQDTCCNELNAVDVIQLKHEALNYVLECTKQWTYLNYCLRRIACESKKNKKLEET